MNVLIAEEFSGVVREAFRKRGHNAWSCDLEPAEDGSPYHLRGDARYAIKRNNGFYFVQLKAHIRWDLLIAHPPCTRLCNSGVRWLYEKGTRNRIPEMWEAMCEAASLFEDMWRGHDIPKVAVENPIMHRYARDLINCGPASQIIQPWQFGHGETKATCLWLRNLPLLVPTDVVDGRVPRVHYASPGPNRWKERSRTYQGIADAMAEQWGSL